MDNQLTPSNYFDYFHLNFKQSIKLAISKVLKNIALLALALFLALLLCPQIVPLNVWKTWVFNPASIINGILTSIPIIILGFASTLILQPWSNNRPAVFNNPKAVLKMGVILSALAGLFEEIIYRWLLFYNAIWAIQILNWLLLGFAGLPLIKWMYLWLFIPVSNFLSLDYLHDFFYHPAGWFIGAALVYASLSFGNQHIYNGLTGFIYSWLVGLYFFFITFNYSIIAAIIVHFVYDIACFGAIALYAKIAKPSGTA